MNRIFDYSKTRSEQNSAAREAFSMATSIRERAEVFAREHPTFAKWGGYALKGIGTAAVAGALVTAAEAGAAAFLTTGASMLATDQAMAAVIENGTEAFVEYAASQGKTEVEAKKFAETAVWAIEMVVTSAAALGLTKLIKNGGAIMTRVASIKSGIGTLATNTFRRTQASAAKIDTTSLQNIVAAAEKSPYVMMEVETQLSRLTNHYKQVDQFVSISGMRRVNLEGVTKPVGELSLIELGILEAEHAFNKIGGFGHVAGTKQHKFAADSAKPVLKRFGERIGMKDVMCEKKVFQGKMKIEDVPQSGYSIYDVVSESQGVVLDYKFFQYDRPDGSIFDATRFQRMISNLPDKIDSVFGIKPIFRDGLHTGKFEAVEVWKRPPQ
jgi:hypothetical protein